MPERKPRKRYPSDDANNERRRKGTPEGRPPELDRVVRTRVTPDGVETVTASQHIIERIAIGQDIGDAAAGADMHRSTVWNWRRAGAAARVRQAAGEDLNDHERAYAQFIDDLEKAETEAELRRLLVITRAGEGMGFLETITEDWIPNPDYDPTVTDPTDRRSQQLIIGNRRVTRAQQAPVWQAAAWYLERRHPARYRRPYGELFIGGQSDADRQARAEALVAQISAVLEPIALPAGSDDDEA